MSGRTYVVQRGDSLPSIAERIYGHGGLWSLIAEANHEQRPDYLKPRVGMVLVIPRDPRAPPFDPRTRRYFVQHGDTLSTIAVHVYRDARLWKLVYDANRDLLSDPGKLRPGQDLFIPIDPAQAAVEEAAAPAPMRLGSHGDLVTALQKDLLREPLGADLAIQHVNERDLEAAIARFRQRFRVTGVFGPATDRAVRRLQYLHGIRADGIVGSRTLRLISLRAGGRKVDPFPRPSASPPERPSNTVAALQRDLLALGFSLAPGGFLDPATRDALHRFQARHGLAHRDTGDRATRTTLYDQTMLLDDDADFDPAEFHAAAFFPGGDSDDETVQSDTPVDTHDEDSDDEDDSDDDDSDEDDEDD